MEEYQVEFNFVDYIPTVDKGQFLYVTSGSAPCVQSRTCEQGLNTNKVVSILGFNEPHSLFCSETSMLHLTRAQALALAGRLIDLVHDMDDADGSGGITFDKLSLTEWSALFLHFFQGMPIEGSLRERFIALGLLEPLTDGQSLGSALPPSVKY